jgi:signal transduction histidine kinase
VNHIGTLAYHFWMQKMQPLRRRNGNQHLHHETLEYRNLVKRKINAYHLFIQTGLIAQGLLQYLAAAFPQLVWQSFGSWLRTILWFGGYSGLTHMEGARLTVTALPKEAHNLQVQAIVRDSVGRCGSPWLANGCFVFRMGSGLYGNRQYENLDTDLPLPIHTTNLQIAYSAGSLTVPERVHFRYKLEGSDRDWQDVGNRHEAVYTNLGPGRYTFRIIAANNDGVWNNTGATLHFTILPAFNQTRLFYALCALLCLLVLYALFRVRTRQVAAAVRGRLEARLADRERIARELHDTLLQGVQGLILRVQAVAGRITQGDPARALILAEQALERADQVLGEGRDRVKELRATADDEADLPLALVAEGEQLVLTHPAQFRTSVEGAHRDLYPIVREEVLFVAREALHNAFQHSQAQHIEAEVSYGESVLHVRIRDDGRGIRAEVLEAGGRPGHFGLLGMRERAQKIRAQLKIWSKPRCRHRDRPAGASAGGVSTAADRTSPDLDPRFELAISCKLSPLLLWRRKK